MILSHFFRQLRGLLRLAAFLLLLPVLLLACNTLFTQTDSVAAMTMHEIRERDDIQLAIVGSSMALYHFNPAIITEETGMITFTAAMTGLMPPGAIALTEELFEHSSPEHIVLVLESGTFDTVKEDPMTQMKLAPYLSSPLRRLRYWAETARQDGMYAERLLLCNTFGHTSAADLVKSLRLRYDHDRAAAQIREEWAGEYEYRDGFLRIVGAEPVTENTQDWFIRRETGNWYEMMPQTQAWLRSYRDLCKRSGAKLTVVISPEMTVTMLREPERLQYLDSAQRFFDAEGIPCYNLMYARESLLPDLNSYYYDYHHRLGEGADVLSRSFARLFRAVQDGEDVAHHFCRSRYEYLAQIDFMTNVWATRETRGGKIHLRADSNRGANVRAEYRFALQHEDGSETPLRDFAEEAEFSFDPALCGVRPGSRLRVYGRAAGGSEIFCYEFPPEDTKVPM